MLTDINPKALEHACQCAGRSVHHFDRMALDLPLRASIVAHARAIEQHEAFRQEVSDAVTDYFGAHLAAEDGGDKLASFIIAKPKPDPLVEACMDAWSRHSDEPGYRADIERSAAELRAALAARGLTITETKEKN